MTANKKHAATFRSVVSKIIVAGKTHSSKYQQREFKKALAGILMALNLLGEKRLEDWMKKELNKFNL